MNADHDAAREVLQGELDREQADVDLDQGIADREQVRGSRDQEPIDAAQLALDADVADEASPVPSQSQALRQGDLVLAQSRRDAHQTQLDDTQRAQTVRQELLDQQQAGVDEPARDASTERDALITEAAAELQTALRLRAEAALARAEDARQRAEDAVRRLQATERRESHTEDRA